MNTYVMTPRGRALLEAREGVRLAAYRDSRGVWTIGVGHTSMAGPPVPVHGMVLTHDEVDALLTKDLAKYEGIVNTNVRVPLADHEFDALVSICYNVEIALSPHSSIVVALNAGDRAAAARDIMKYVVPVEITGRRQGEQRQFMRPYV